MIHPKPQYSWKWPTDFRDRIIYWRHQAELMGGLKDLHNKELVLPKVPHTKYLEFIPSKEKPAVWCLKSCVYCATSFDFEAKYNCWQITEILIITLNIWTGTLGKIWHVFGLQIVLTKNQVGSSGVNVNVNQLQVKFTDTFFTRPQQLLLRRHFLVQLINSKLMFCRMCKNGCDIFAVY